MDFAVTFQKGKKKKEKEQREKTRKDRKDTNKRYFYKSSI